MQEFIPDLVLFAMENLESRGYYPRECYANMEAIEVLSDHGDVLYLDDHVYDAVYGLDMFPMPRALESNLRSLYGDIAIVVVVDYVYEQCVDAYEVAFGAMPMD